MNNTRNSLLGRVVLAVVLAAIVAAGTIDSVSAAGVAGRGANGGPSGPSAGGSPSSPGTPAGPRNEVFAATAPPNVPCREGSHCRPKPLLVLPRTVAVHQACAGGTRWTYDYNGTWVRLMCDHRRLRIYED